MLRFVVSLGAAISSVFGLTAGKIVFADELRAAPVQWECSEPHWIHEPAFVDDVLIGKVASRCHMKGLSAARLKQLFDVIKKDFETSKRFVQHQTPVPAKHQGLPGFRYDMTDKLQEEEQSLSIRQDTFLGYQGLRLLYETSSTDVSADGHAAYLRKVFFKADIQSDAAQFENQVDVERPWYAFPPVLFRTVGKRITREKFTKARDELLGYFSKQLE